MDFNFEQDETPEPRKNPNKKRYRKNKLKLVFDSEERKNFLQGFRKRKQERKEKYIEKLERDLTKEKKRIRQQTERAAKRLSNSHSILPEVKSLIENMPEKTETYDLGNTLVSITSLDDQVHRNLSTIKEESSDSESEAQAKVNSRNSRKLVESLKRKLGGDDDFEEATKSDPFFNPVNDDELDQSDLSSEEEEKEVYYNPMEMLKKQNEPAPLAPGEKAVSKAKLEKDANRMLQQSSVFKKMQRIKQNRSKKFRLFRLQPSESKEEGGGAGKKSEGGKGGKVGVAKKGTGKVTGKKGNKKGGKRK